jgi:hypothetical protein
MGREKGGEENREGDLGDTEMRFSDDRKQQRAHVKGRIYFEEGGFQYRILYAGDFVWDGETPLMCVERNLETGREVYILLAVIGDIRDGRRLLEYFNSLCEPEYSYRLRD